MSSRQRWHLNSKWWGVVLAALLVVLGVCGRQDEEREHGVPAWEEPGASRVIRPVSWDTLWSIRSSDRDTVLLNPVRVLARGGRVLVLDLGSSRVVALRALTGQVDWFSGREGGGPGEFRAPAFIAPDRSGGFVVGDRETGRLTFLTEKGRVTRTLNVPGISGVHGLCVPAPDRLLLFSPGLSNPFSAGPVTPLLFLSWDGEILASFSSPWTDLVSAPPLLTEVHLANVQGAEGCWVALTKGRGFTRFRYGQFEPPRLYVEDLPLPKIEEQVRTEGGRPLSIRRRVLDPWRAADGIAVDPDFLAVPFIGRSEYAGRVIDVYDGNGRYRESYLAPMIIQSLAIEDGVFYILHSEGLYPALTALLAQKP